MSHFRSYPWQVAPWRDKSPILLLDGGSGSGKALSLDTPILTMRGWLNMGTICVGDIAFDEKGNRCNVINTSEVLYDRSCYEVVFSTCERIISDANHEWFTETKKERRAELENNRRGANVREYGEIRRTYEIDVAAGHAIRKIQGINVPTNEPLFIPPYTLGAWLGDGTSKSGDMTCCERDIDVIHNISTCGYKIGKKRGDYTYPIVGLGYELSEYGLLNNKHIPDEYFTACYEDRLSLLQGLLDTDGSVSIHGHVEICQVNERLIVDIQRLLATLGIRSSVVHNKAGYKGYKQNDAGYYIDCGIRHRINFSANMSVFRLKRKSERCVAKTTDRVNWHYIKSVKQVESVPLRCIQVDSSSKMYLVGNTLIPTHNSRLAAEKVHAYCLKYPGVTGIVGRKDRASASKSVVPLLRYAVQGDTDWGVYRKTDQLFEYANESRIYVVGLKDEGQLEALKSITGKHGDPDIAWFEEANSLSLTDHETIQTRLRGKMAPWHQLIYTTNPDAPDHWINKLLIEGGQAKRYFSLPTDNPDAPQRYIDILDNLTGVRKQKYRFGLWVRAEGVIYVDYDSSKHLVDLYNLNIDRTGRFIVGIDFGYTNPFSASLWYIDNNDKMYEIRQIYYTRRTVLEHVPAIREMVEGYPIEAWITDHDAEDRATLENAMGITTIPAYKSVKDGIEAVMQRYKDNRLFHVRGCLMEEDQRLKDEHKPTCTYEEIPGYRWSDKKQDTPVKEADHGVDSERYVCAYVDKIGDRTTPVDAGKSVQIENYAR